LYSVGSLGVVVIIELVAGSAAVGGFRSVLLLLGPVQLLTIAGESVALPAAARAHAEAGPRGARRVALVYSLVLSAVFAACGLVLVMLGSRLMSLAFGHEFAGYAPL